MEARGGARPKNNYNDQACPPNTGGRRQNDSDNSFDEKREGSCGQSLDKYDGEAPPSWAAEGCDRSVPQSHDGYDKGAPGPSGACSQEPSRGWRASGSSQSNPTRDFHRGESRWRTQGYTARRHDQAEQQQWIRGQTDTRDQRSREGHTGRSYDQGHSGGYESRPQGSGQQARFPGARQRSEDGQDDIKQLKENMAKMVIRESGKQLSLAGCKGDLTVMPGDLTDMPGERQMHELVRYGSTGVRVETSTNLFPFEVTKKFYCYSIEFSLEIESTRAKKNIIKMIEEQLGLTSNYVTDGSTLCTTDMLNINLPMDIEAPSKRIFRVVTVKYVATIEPNSRLGIKMLNVIFGSLLQNNGWKWSYGIYYDYSQMIPINQTGYSAYPGFFISILEYESGIRLLLDVNHQIISNHNAWEASQRDGRTLQIRVTGRNVFTCYNAKIYKVEEVDLTKTVNWTFKYRGRDTTIVDYYSQKHKVTITDRNQPLLVVRRYRSLLTSGDLDIMYLVPELCLVTGIDKRDVRNGKLMRKVYSITKPDPNIRACKMEDFVKNIQKDEVFMDTLKAFGVVFGSSMESVVGRVLPSVKYSRMISDISRPEPCVTGRLSNWVLIHPVNQRHVETFLSNLNKSMSLLRLICSDPVMRGYHDYHDMVRHLKSVSGNCDLVVVITRDYNQGDYRQIKRILCLTNPIPSQVVTAKHVEDANFDCMKIAVQIICKMGGAGWVLSNMTIRETMIIGVDLYIDQSISYVGFVATMDDRCTRHHSTWCKIENWYQNGSQQLRLMITECMDAYFKWNRHHCGTVVLYLNGPCDGFLNTKLKEMVKTVTELNLNTKVVYILVDEESHSYFFLKRDGRDRPTYENVDRRMVVDEMATRPGWSDFFIVRKGAKDGPGTVAPTHFNVDFNSSDMTIDAIQVLTHQLCFLYFNLLGTIGIPAVCRYAYMVASMIGQDLEGHFPSDKLKDRLFYL